MLGEESPRPLHHHREVATVRAQAGHGRDLTVGLADSADLLAASRIAAP